MDERPESSSRVRMSEHKVHRKDWCWYMRVCPKKVAKCKRVRSRRGGTLYNGIRANFHGFTGACVTVAQTWCAWLVWT